MGNIGTYYFTKRNFKIIFYKYCRITKVLPMKYLNYDTIMKPPNYKSGVLNY